MRLCNKLHAFIWNSMTVNNCNTYLINGPTRVLVDPGHIDMFDHVQKGLMDLGLEIPDIGLVICTHAHPDHIEAVQLFKGTPALIAMHKMEWQFVESMDDYILASFSIRSDSIATDFFLKEGDL